MVDYKVDYKVGDKVWVEGTISAYNGYCVSLSIPGTATVTFNMNSDIVKKHIPREFKAGDKVFFFDHPILIFEIVAIKDDRVWITNGNISCLTSVCCIIFAD
jgi:hypothetical protein